MGSGLSAEEQHLSELREAARRAGSIVTEHIDAMVERAEREAKDIRRDAESDAERRAEDIRRKAEGDASRRAEDILRHAETDGERTRRDALESARRVLERLHALEQPLGQLVMSLHMEVDRVAAELGSGGVVDAQSMELPGRTSEARTEAPPERTDARPAPAPPSPSEEPEVEVEEAEPEPEPVEPEGVEAKPEEAPEPEEAQDEPVAAGTAAQARAETDEPEPERGPELEPRPEPQHREGLLSRFRRARGRAFISTEGYCAVCQRAFKAGSKENLDASGWLVSGDVGLCPSCQNEGWQLPEGARLPFRRGGS
jgi:vacuolar-type H+-ATPase subunit H